MYFAIIANKDGTLTPVISPDDDDVLAQFDTETEAREIVDKMPGPKGREVLVFDTLSCE